jgi:hypothetical protein
MTHTLLVKEFESGQDLSEMRFCLPKHFLDTLVCGDRENSYIHSCWSSGTQDRDGGYHAYRPFRTDKQLFQIESWFSALMSSTNGDAHQCCLSEAC